MKVFERATAARWWPVEPRHRRTLAIVLAAGFLLRIAWVAYAAREPTQFNSGDPWAYLLHGREIAAGEGYHGVLTATPTAFYPIGYPLYIALFAWPAQHGLLPDDVTRIVAFSQAVLGTLTVLFVWVIARRVAGGRVALVAAALVAAWPGLVLLTASLNLETVFVALLMAALAVLAARPPDEPLPSGRRAMVAGTLFGLSALVRPFSLPVLAIVIVAFLGRRPRNVGAALRVASLLALPMVLILLPAMLRNQRQVGTLSLSTNMGETFCLDHHVGAMGSFAYPPECFEGFDDVPPADLERVRNQEDFRRGLRFIREHPISELKLIVKRAWYMHEGDHDGLVAVEAGTATPFIPAPLRTTLRAIADWWYRASLGLAVLALPCARRRRSPRGDDGLIVFLAGVVLTVIPLELYGYTRFHVPVIPFQAMLAATTLVWLADRRPRAVRAPS